MSLQGPGPLHKDEQVMASPETFQVDFRSGLIDLFKARLQCITSLDKALDFRLGERRNDIGLRTNVIKLRFPVIIRVNDGERGLME